MILQLSRHLLKMLVCSLIVVLVSSACSPSASQIQSPTPQNRAIYSPTAEVIPSQSPTNQTLTTQDLSQFQYYLLEDYNFSIRLPSEWRVDLREEDNQFRISKKPNSLQESLRIYGRYSPYSDPNDAYDLWEAKSEEQRDFSLDNGSKARWFRKGGCQYVVWIHQQIQRIVQGCGVNQNYQALFKQIASTIDAPLDQFILGSTSEPNPTFQAFQAAMLDDSALLPSAGWHWESERALFPDDWTMGYDASDFCNYLCVPVVATPLEVEADFARNREHEPELWVSLNYMRTEHSDPYNGIFKANSFAQMIPSKNHEPVVLFIEELEDHSMFKLVWIEGEYTWNLYARIPNDQRAEQYLPIVQQIFQSALNKVKNG